MLKNSSCLFLTRRCHTHVAEIEVVCLDEKFPDKIEMKAEGMGPRVPHLLWAMVPPSVR